MKIQNISTLNFSKKAILTCQIKNAKTKEKQSATLYSYNPARNLADKKELKSNSRTARLYFPIERSSLAQDIGFEFYALKVDDTDEVVSCAQVTHHLKPRNSKLAGLSTQIDALDTNMKFINPAEPLIAGVVKKAQERYDSFVVLTIHPEEMYGLKGIKLSEHKGDSYIPEKRFNSIIDKSSERSQIEF